MTFRIYLSRAEDCLVRKVSRKRDLLWKMLTHYRKRIIWFSNDIQTIESKCETILRNANSFSKVLWMFWGQNSSISASSMVFFHTTKEIRNGWVFYFSIKCILHGFTNAAAEAVRIRRIICFQPSEYWVREFFILACCAS